MIETIPIFKREYSEYVFDKFNENPLSLKSLTNVNDIDILDNEMFVNEESIKIKNKGVIKEMIVENNKVILKETGV